MSFNKTRNYLDKGLCKKSWSNFKNNIVVFLKGSNHALNSGTAWLWTTDITFKVRISTFKSENDHQFWKEIVAFQKKLFQFKIADLYLLSWALFCCLLMYEASYPGSTFSGNSSSFCLKRSLVFFSRRLRTVWSWSLPNESSSEVETADHEAHDDDLRIMVPSGRRTQPIKLDL